MDLRTRLVSNTLSNGIKLASTALAGLVVPPILIARLGAEQYGVYALLVAIGNLVYALDLGLLPALMKVVAEDFARGDTEALNRHCSTVVSIALGSAALATAAACAATPLLRRAFFQSVTGVESLQLLIAAFVSVTALGMVCDSLQATLSGVQRMDESNLIASASVIVQMLGIIAFIGAGLRLWGIAGAIGLAHGTRGMATYVRLRRHVPGFRPRPVLRFARGEVGRLLFLGSGGIAIRIGGTISGQLNKFLIAHFAGLRWVAYYDLASRITAQLAGMASIMFTPLVPSVSYLSALEDRSRIGRLTARSLTYMNLCALPFVIFIFVHAPEIIQAWIGPGMEPVALTLRILLVGHYINVLSGPAFHTLVGLGRPGPGIWAAVINASVFILAAVAGAVSIGYWGIVVAECLAASAGGLFLVLRYHYLEQVPVGRVLWSGTIVPACLCVASAGLLAGGAALLGSANGRTLWYWGLRFVPYWVMAVILFWAVGILGRQEWDLVRELFRRSGSTVPA